VTENSGVARHVLEKNGVTLQRIVATVKDTDPETFKLYEREEFNYGGQRHWSYIELALEKAWEQDQGRRPENDTIFFGGQPIRYTAALCRALRVAGYSAEKFKHKYIGTEHLLLGLLESEPIASGAFIILCLGVNFNTLKKAVEELLTPEKQEPGAPPETQNTASTARHPLTASVVWQQVITPSMTSLPESDNVVPDLTVDSLESLVRAAIKQRQEQKEKIKAKVEAAVPPAPAPTPVNEDRQRQDKVITEVLAERNRQDARWGTIGEHPHEVGAWLTIMEHYLTRAKKAWVETSGDRDALREILKTTAVGVACMEQHGIPTAD
jgi:hypothetical protein